MALLVIGVIFLLLNLPRDVFSLMFACDQEPFTTFETSALFLTYFNHSINFLMYFVSGRKFRLAAKETLKCRWCRRARCELT